MQIWRSFHFYPLETQDAFLARGIRPFLAQFVWPVNGTRAFFVRYSDEKGPHIRLRIRGEMDWMEETIRPNLQSQLANRGEMIETPYETDAARFGGEDALLWAEEYFHVCTRVVLDRLNREYTYGDSMYDALRMHVITAFSLGFDPKKAAWYFDRLGEQWFNLFFSSDEQQQPHASLRTEVYGQFDISLAPQLEELKSNLLDLWNSLEHDKIDAKQPEWLRWVRGNQLILPEFGNNLEKALPSLLHLTNNRIGVVNQDEVYLNFILSKTLI